MSIKTKLLVLGIICASYLHAQVNNAFEGVNSTWVNTYHIITWEEDNPVPNYTMINTKNYCMLFNDTLINSTSYRVVSDCFDAYVGAIREEESTVFFIPKDSLQEFLLYDFDVEIGEGIEDLYALDQRGEPYLYNIENGPERIDSILISGEFHKKLIFEGATWIEGLGSSSGLFSGFESDNNSIISSLYCMSKNDTIYYPLYMAGKCNLNIEDNQEKSMTSLNYQSSNEGTSIKDLFNKYDNDVYWNVDGLLYFPNTNLHLAIRYYPFQYYRETSYSVSIGFDGDILNRAIFIRR